jgi:hypothetical protein
MIRKGILRGEGGAACTGPVSSVQPAGVRWPGYAAAGCALAFAVVTLYWGLGGRLGLDLVGKEIIRLADDRDAGFLIAAWVSGLLKLAGAVLALALVQPWGRRVFPRRLLLAVGWACSALLIVYGAGTVINMLLVVAGGIPVPAEMDWRGFYGHLCLWDPWFLLWGLLLALATRNLARPIRPAP